MFPNEHAVYLHDTPGRHLFNTTERAYSHGCVRVDQPMKFGEIILGRDEGWTEQRLRGMVGGGERTVRLSRPLPVHLTYMTHVVSASGELTTYEDIYGFHRRVKSALGLGG
jgi:murein L,D-transpeptidase YcbB/YkuD